MSAVVVRYDGTDITDDIELADAVFSSLVNGRPGQSKFRVKDGDRDKSFTIGKPLTLDVDGDRIWTGFVQRVSRVYAFPAQDVTTDESVVTRLLEIEGIDINILFRKRFVFNQAQPTNIGGVTYNGPTADTVALEDLISDWLDLSGDGLDTTSLVENIGNINVNQKANVFFGSESWESAMRSITRLTAGVFYINPDKQLVMTDVDTPNAAFGLSDDPDGVTTVGYREMEILHNSAEMINDALVWGEGGGSASAIFDRLTDATSIGIHDRWQFGQHYPGVWKPATLDKISDSIVNGSPLSKRGHKNDAISVTCSTFTPGFLPAQKVAFDSEVYGFSDTFPIRSMEVTFPATGRSPKYRLILSHELDQPFDLIDPTSIHPIIFPPIHIDPPPPPPPTPPPLMCGILDSFGRSLDYTVNHFAAAGNVADGWGTGEELAWTVSGHNPYFRVDGSAGIMEMKYAEYPTGPFEGSIKTATTQVPLGIDMHNIVLKLKIGRLDRLYPRSLAVASGSGLDLFHGWAVHWDRPSGAIDGDPFNRPGTQWPGTTSAQVSAGVTTDPISATLGFVIDGPGVADKTIVRGARPEPNYPIGPWIASNPGGFVAEGIYRYAGRCATLYSVEDVLLYENNGIGLRYFGGWTVDEVYYSGPDAAAFLFDQKVFIQIRVGSMVLTIDRSEGGVSGYTSDGFSSPAYGLSVSGVGGSSSDGAKVIEPGFDYYIRFFHPNPHGGFVKVWESWLPESEAWLAGQQEDGWDGPIADLGSNRTISVTAKTFPWQQYTVEIGAIATCGPLYGYDDGVPFGGATPPPGSQQEEEVPRPTPPGGHKTSYPYVPGTLVIFLNGLIQRAGVDYTETDPSTGAYDFTTEPDSDDKITLFYVVA